MMPQGVEHSTHGLQKRYRLRVTFSVMPKGVEHIVSYKQGAGSQNRITSLALQEVEHRQARTRGSQEAGKLERLSIHM